MPKNKSKKHSATPLKDLKAKKDVKGGWGGSLGGGIMPADKFSPVPTLNLNTSTLLNKSITG